MGKVKNMATPEQRHELSEKLTDFKRKYKMTYREIVLQLNISCKHTTLAVLANYKGKSCSFRLYENIIEGIKIFKKERDEKKRTKKQELEDIKKEYINEIQNITTTFTKKLTKFFGE